MGGPGDHGRPVRRSGLPGSGPGRDCPAVREVIEKGRKRLLAAASAGGAGPAASAGGGRCRTVVGGHGGVERTGGAVTVPMEVLAAGIREGQIGVLEIGEVQPQGCGTGDEWTHVLTTVGRVGGTAAPWAWLPSEWWSP